MKGHSINDEDRLHHIKDALDFILSHTESMAEDEFYENEVLKKAVVRDLEVIGEACSYLSVSLKALRPEVPWSQIVATRHKMIHEYFHVSYVMVWDIIKNDLPVFREQIIKILSEAI